MKYRKILCCFIWASISLVARSEENQGGDNFVPPVEISRLELTYPPVELRREVSGWVIASYLISQDGSVSNIRIEDGSGSGYFEEEVLKALPKVKYEPAKLNGRPVDIVWYRKIFFTTGANDDRYVTPRGDFYYEEYYERKVKDLEEASREGSVSDIYWQLFDSLLYGFVVTESRFSRYLLLRAQYAHSMGDLNAYAKSLRWATELDWYHVSEPVDATTYSVEETYLLVEVDYYSREKDFHVSPQEVGAPPPLSIDLQREALSSLVEVYIQNNAYVEAVQAYTALNAIPDSEAEIAQFKQAIDQIILFKETDQPYPVRGEIDISGLRRFLLLKTQFYVDEIQGELKEIQFRCPRHFSKLEFDAELIFSVSGDAQNCLIEITGTPGTTFRVVQI